MVSTDVARDSKNQEQAVADRIMRDRQYEGRQFYVGDFIAILGDEVVAVSGSYDAVAKALSARQPRHSRGMICAISDAGPDVIR